MQRPSANSLSVRAPKTFERKKSLLGKGIAIDEICCYYSVERVKQLKNPLLSTKTVEREV